MGGNLLGVCKWTEDLCLWKKCPGGCLLPPLGYIHDHNIQIFSSLKPLGQSKTLCGASFGKGNES